MQKLIVALGVLLASFAFTHVPQALAQDAPATQPGDSGSSVIDVSDKAALDAAMGKDVVIDGVVDSAAWSSSGKVMLIQFKKAAETKVAAAVFEKQKANFDKAFSGDVTKALTGAHVRIKGTLKDYKG